jgi:pyridoxine/pyridoxamine 5'-phosphate oxidase
MTMADPVPELDTRFSDPDAVATPWPDAQRAIETAELFWIATVRPNGQPNVTPLPAVWDDGALHFCTGPEEQKGVNLARNPRCTLTTGVNRWKEGLDVVVEGDARRITDHERLGELAARWAAKYHGDWQFDVKDGAFHHGGGAAYVFAVEPNKVLAFAKGQFAQTRYRF